MIERRDGESPQAFYTRIMLAFIHVMPEHGVNRFSFREGEETKIIPHAYIGYFPGAFGLQTDMVMITTDDGFNAGVYRTKALALRIPDHLQNLGIPDDEESREAITRLSGGSMPLYVLVIGEGKESKEETALLFSVAGTPPQVALERLQDGLRKGIASQN